MNAINNHFTKTVEPDRGKPGTFTISGGVVSPVSGTYLKGQYVRLVGPVLCSGVFQVTDIGEKEISLQGLPEGAEEKFKGYVYGLAPPPDFLALVGDIEKFQKENGSGLYISEVLPDGYSYQKTTGQHGVTITWGEFYSDRLSQYRRMFDNPAAEIRENNR